MQFTTDERDKNDFFLITFIAFICGCYELPNAQDF